MIHRRHGEMLCKFMLYVNSCKLQRWHELQTFTISIHCLKTHVSVPEWQNLPGQELLLCTHTPIGDLKNLLTIKYLNNVTIAPLVSYIKLYYGIPFRSFLSGKERKVNESIPFKISKMIWERDGRLFHYLGLLNKGE